jgi:MICOS complex subunit MIC19
VISSEAPESESAPSYLEKVTGDADQLRKAQLSRDSVSKEIDGLRKKLAGRKKLEQMDPEVERAKNDLVQCLRLNDRKPLDCWAEREAFKREVAKLERRFVERTVR